MESLDDVIDAMIADQVIRRHRRKWLIALVVAVLLVVVVYFAGGWEQRKGRTVPTLRAPVTVEAGRFEFGVGTATIIRTPKTQYGEAEARVEVSIDVKNLDSEKSESSLVAGNLLQLVSAAGKDPIEADGATCHGRLNYVFVYGLPARSCSAKFEVPPDFSAEEIELGLLGERFVADEAIFGATDEPYWQAEEPVAVVKVRTTTRTETR